LLTLLITLLIRWWFTTWWCKVYSIQRFNGTNE